MDFYFERNLIYWDNEVRMENLRMDTLTARRFLIQDNNHYD